MTPTIDNIIYLEDYRKLRQAAESVLQEQEIINQQVQQKLGQFLLDLHMVWELYKASDYITEADLEMITIMLLTQRREGFSPTIEPV